MNPFVKGWKYAFRSFWGMCDEGLPRNVTRRNSKYVWQPGACSLERFHAGRFCHHFQKQASPRAANGGKPRNHDLMFVGDSYTGQMFVSLLAHLGGAFHREFTPKKRVIEHHGAFVHGVPTQEFRVDGLACVEQASVPELRRWHFGKKAIAHPTKRSPPLRVQFFRNEFLVTNVREPGTGFRHEYPWVPSVKPDSIVIIQVCGWFHANYQGFENNLKAAFNAIEKRIGRPDWASQIVVVSSNIGHRRCHNITDWPLKRAVNYSAPYSKRDNYSWHNINMLNSKAEAMASSVGATFLDITTMLSYRPDGHMESDCAHWCLPGAYDIAATLLHNAVVGTFDNPLARLFSPRGAQLGSGHV